MSCYVSNEVKLDLFFKKTQQLLENDSIDNRKKIVYIVTHNLNSFLESEENKNLLTKEQNKVVTLLRSFIYESQRDLTNESISKTNELIMQILGILSR